MNFCTWQKDSAKVGSLTNSLYLKLFHIYIFVVLKIKKTVYTFLYIAVFIKIKKIKMNK